MSIGAKVHPDRKGQDSLRKAKRAFGRPEGHLADQKRLWKAKGAFGKPKELFEIQKTFGKIN
jgi:hypothetical protein